MALLGLAGDPASATETENRLAASKLAANKLAANKLAANRLAGRKSWPRPTGREVYAYIIGCALPESLAIEVAVPGAHDTAPPDTHYACSDGLCVFEGGLGLAEGGLELRDCAEEDPSNPSFTYCGFRYAGDCGDFTTEDEGAFACDDFEESEGFYGRCHAGEGFGPGVPYREVITTYTEE